MMRTLPLYLSRLFFAKNVAISLAMVAILGVLDALSKGDILPPDAGFAEHLKFMALRAPLIFDQVFIFAFLLSLLVTYVALIRRNELVPIICAGMSAAHQILALAPAVVSASAFYALVIDQASPRAQEALVAWLGPKAVVKNATLVDDLWIADGLLLVRIETVEEGMLKGLTLFERVESGVISAVNYAAKAEEDENGWRLDNVTQVRFDAETIDPLTHWQSTLDASTIRLLALEPRYLSIAELWTLSQLRGSGNRTSSVYEMWILGRVTMPVAALGFLIVTVLIMQKLGRDPKPELTLVAAMGAGFLYVISDNIAKTLPENTNVPATVAAVAPLACLILACLILALRSARE